MYEALCGEQLDSAIQELSLLLEDRSCLSEEWLNQTNSIAVPVPDPILPAGYHAISRIIRCVCERASPDDFILAAATPELFGEPGFYGADGTSHECDFIEKIARPLPHPFVVRFGRTTDLLATYIDDSFCFGNAIIYIPSIGTSILSASREDHHVVAGPRRIVECCFGHQVDQAWQTWRDGVARADPDYPVIQYLKEVSKIYERTIAPT